MILTCPECATSYFVDDAVLGGGGRTVRCTSCGNAWKAYPEPALDIDDLAGPALPTVEAKTGAEAREDAPAFDDGEPGMALDDLETSPADEPFAESLPKAFRARAETERRVREAATQGAVWAGMGALLAMIVTLALVFRIDVVRLFPRAASAYAQIGLPVNGVGLTLENVHAQPGLQDGRAALVVSGVMRNIRARAVTAPPISITLLDKSGHRLMTRTAAPGDPLVPPGQTRNFAVTLLEPPPAATDLDVEFARGEAGKAAPRPSEPARHAEAAPALRATVRAPTAAPVAPPPMEAAQPLPSDSPYALSDQAH